MKTEGHVMVYVPFCEVVRSSSDVTFSFKSTREGHAKNDSYNVSRLFVELYSK